MSDSSWLHGLQHARLPCPSPSPMVCPSSCPLNQWCHPTISFSVTLFSFCLIFPRIREIRLTSPVSQLFVPSSQRFGSSASASVLLMNIQGGLISFRIDWFDLLAVQGTLENLLQYHSSKALVLPRSVFFILQLSHPYMTTGKTIALTRWTFVGKAMSVLFNMLSRLVGYNFSSKEQASFNFMAAITICIDFGAPK